MVILTKKKPSKNGLLHLQNHPSLETNSLKEKSFLTLHLKLLNKKSTNLQSNKKSNFHSYKMKINNLKYKYKN